MTLTLAVSLVYDALHLDRSVSWAEFADSLFLGNHRSGHGLDPTTPRTVVVVTGPVSVGLGVLLESSSGSATDSLRVSLRLYVCTPGVHRNQNT